MKKLLLFFACAMFLAAGALAQATWYVDANYEGGDSDGTEGKPYVSIQAAIDAAASGDEILVALGDYPEILTITKSIAITGVADGENRPVVSPPTNAIAAKPRINEIIWIMPDQGKLVPASPLEVSIAGLELNGKGVGQVYAGIVSWDAILKLDNVVIHNINMNWGSVYGVRINAGEVTVQESRIYNIRHEPHNGEEAVPLKKESLHAVGIYAYRVEGFSVTGTEIQGIRSADGDASGISIHKRDVYKDGPSPGFEISGNNIGFIEAMNYAAGIFSRETTGLLIHDNTIENIGGEYKGFGIVLEDQLEQVRDNMGNGPVKLTENDHDVEISGNTISRVFSAQNMGPGLQTEKFQMNPFLSFGIHAMTPQKRLFIHDNSITSAQASTGKGFVPSGPGTGIFFFGEDVHILDNELAHCMIGAMSFFVPNLLVEDNTFENPLIGVMAMDGMLYAKKSARYDFPFELPPPPEMDFAKVAPNMGSLTFIGNTITGMEENMSFAGIFAMLGGMYLKEGEPELGLEARFIAQGNLIENFMDGISLEIRSGQLAEINGQNIIQNNEYGVYVYHGADRFKTELSPLVIINHNTIQGNNFGVINGNYEDFDHGNNGGNGGILKGEVMAPFIDAKFNYWDTADGPGFVLVGDRKIEEPGNGVSEGVWYSPWLGFHPGTPPGDMTYYVDDSGSIQDAIDMASPGDIIRILSGDYEGDIVVGQGDGLTLYPGDSPACVGILGDLTVASGNTLFIEMDGTTPACGEGIPAKNGSGEYTQVFVFGEVYLGGITLDLNLGFAPEVGNQFEIIVSDNPITGMFSQGESITVEYEGVFYTFDILYNPNGNATKENGYMVVLELQPMDEPVAVPLSGWAIALGMLLMAGFVAFRFRM